MTVYVLLEIEENEFNIFGIYEKKQSALSMEKILIKTGRKTTVLTRETIKEPPCAQ
jgi:hypothetical protein